MLRYGPHPSATEFADRCAPLFPCGDEAVSSDLLAVLGRDFGAIPARLGVESGGARSGAADDATAKKGAP
jgi:hypothetical protein